MGSRLDANSNAVRKRIEKHTFEDEEGEEYESSKFGGFNDYFRRKKIKLQNLDAQLRTTTNNPPIFRGVVAHVNGYTQPSLNDLHTMIVSHGGGFMQYLDGKTTVTHVIASNLTPKKKVEFARYRIVKPAWVVDSIQAGKLLPWDSYRVVDEGVGQRILGFENGSVTSQVNQALGGYRDQTDRSWYTTQVAAIAQQLNANGEPEALEDVLDNEQISAARQQERQLSTSDSRRSDAGASSTELKRELSDPELQQHDGQDEQVGNSTSGRLLGDDLDLYTIPALNDSFSESVSNTQDKGQRSQPESSQGRPAVPNFSGVSIDRPPSIFDEPGKSTSAASHMNLGAEQKQESDTVTAQHEAIAPEQAGPLEERQKDDELAAHQTITDDGVLVEPSIETNAIVKDVRSADDMTPEEHNAILLADPKIWKSTVVNPGFLKQYYEESRLHHLSAWKASLKTQLQALAKEKTSSQKAKDKRPLGARRYILHVDFDSFFAAVSLKKHPQYVDKPVVIAHGNGAGAEIASSNYPARKFGIKNGMWMKHAQKMCPDLKVLPYDFKAYEEASRHFYEAIIDTGGVVQSVSVDEALVDVSGQCIAAGGHDGKGVQEGSIWREQAEADGIALGLREKVKEKTGCAVSVGIGSNILLAKVALRKAKPAGQYHVKPEEVLDFLGALTMQDLPGIAWSIGGKLEEIGVKYVRDVRDLSKERMISVLGPKTGEKVWDYSRGIDRTEVGDQVVRKSVSAEVNWGIRFVTQEQAEEFIQSLCDELHKRLVNEGVKGRQLTMKIMRRAADAPRDPPKHLGHGKCDTFNKSIVLGVATNDKKLLGREAISILRGWGFSPGELRGIGCQMQKLEPIKGLPETLHDSSQRRLQFTTTGPEKSTAFAETADYDDIDSPQKPKAPPPPHPAAAFAKEALPGEKARAPLNVSGTQFVIPSQVDPAVIAELPPDIRRRLFPAGKETDKENIVVKEREDAAVQLETSFPTKSQLDPEALEALPEDMRAEIIAQYHQSPRKNRNQAVLPQSPRKDRAIKVPKKLITPTKKRGRPLGIGSKARSAALSTSTLTQSNFVAGKPPHEIPAFKDTDVDNTTRAEEISADFLSALPEDIRQEVLAQARRERMQQRGGIDVSTSAASLKRKQQQALQKQQQANIGIGQRVLHLPSQPPKPTFTSRRLSELPDLRNAMSAWFDEFREGPYAEDTEALVLYLRKVVLDEGDMAKAVAVAKWLKWVIGEGNSQDRAPTQIPPEEEQITWDEAVAKVEAGIQQAVKERGLGEVEI